ncbi:MAG: hypothetical protein H6577_27540 [Lewinellaceae bacterium]|nr:hypothetical protein [Saprospiraceae bacterium]MCB9341899.1 hypothetical protein [Lewinellaceae bacterium]
MKKYLLGAVTAILILPVLTLLPSCGNDGDDPTTCNTSNVSFAKDIAPIISSECAGVECHTGSNPLSGHPFNDYAGVKAQVDAQKLYGSVAQLQGFLPMPRKNDGTGGTYKLKDCEIAQIKAWVDAGAPNN